MIPEEAIDAAADALVASTLGDHVGINGEEFVEAARAALEAAAPYLRARALEDAAEAWQVRMDTIGRGSVEAKAFLQMRADNERSPK